MQRHPINRSLPLSAPDSSSPSSSPAASSYAVPVPLSLSRSQGSPSPSLSGFGTGSGSSRRVSKPTSIDEDDDAIADPRPWESAKPAKLYGSLPSTHNYNPLISAAEEYDEKNLPMFHPSGEENEARRRHAAGGGEKDGPMGGGEKSVLYAAEDDQGKWMKGYGAGPGVGGRRGLPPRQRLTGWVSCRLFR